MVFVAASDETAGKDHRSTFSRAGFVAPENDWSQCFAPAWDERVLNGPPAIPYLHMTDIRSPQWRSEHGLSGVAAEQRDEAIRVIASTGSVFAILSKVDAGHFRDVLANHKVIARIGAKPYSLEPDYMCFLAFAYVALKYVTEEHPDAEKVDFIVEHNGNITRHIGDFHASMENGLREAGNTAWADLVGELIAGGKDRVPLQAADVLCWHSQRRELGTLSRTDARRYGRLAHRLGFQWEWTRDEIAAFAGRATAAGVQRWTRG
jgi:hypothetical protein